MLLKETIDNYYTSVFTLTQQHKYNIYEIDNMLPYEFNHYINKLNEYLEDQENKNKKR